jgi:large subunit ribosomal protein L9
MKVILLKDVPKVGRAGEVKEVSEGFAQNMLFPQRKAERATPEKVASLKKAHDLKEKQEHDKVLHQFEALKKINTLTLHVRCTTEGVLFEAVTPHKLAATLREKGLAMPEEAFHIKQPIKKIGNYAVPVQVGAQEWNLAVEVKAQQ